MPKPAILHAEPIDWTYDDLADEVEQHAISADLEPPHGPSLSDLAELMRDEETARAAEDLERVAELDPS